MKENHKMGQEKDMLFLMALVAAGVVLASGLAAFMQWMVVIPITIAGVYHNHAATKPR
jgi:hypothetical protein